MPSPSLLRLINNTYVIYNLRPFCEKLRSNISSLDIHEIRLIPKLYYNALNAVVTPLRKAASYEPRIAIFGIWVDTWLSRGKYGIYVAVRGSYGALNGGLHDAFWKVLPRKISPIYCRVSYVAVTRILSLVLSNTWHYVIIRRRKFWFLNLRCSYEAALRKGVTTA